MSRNSDAESSRCGDAIIVEVVLSAGEGGAESGEKQSAVGVVRVEVETLKWGTRIKGSTTFLSDLWVPTQLLPVATNGGIVLLLDETLLLFLSWRITTLVPWCGRSTV